MKVLSILLLLLSACAHAPRIEEHGWTRFRGPNGRGVATDDAYPVRIGPDSHVRWQVEFAPGYSSPVLNESLVFLTASEGERLFTYAVEQDTGKIAWRREAPRERRTEFHAKNHAAAASAAVDHDTVAVFFDEYGLLAYDLEGNERFRLPLGPFNNVYGMGSSPVIADDVIVLACDQSSGSFVIGVDKKGRQLWRQERPQAVSGHCTPVLKRTPTRTLALLPGSYLLDAYDVKTGERVWWIRGLPAEMKSVPVLDGDTIYVHGYTSPMHEKGKLVTLPPWSEALERMDANGDGTLSPDEMEDQRIARLFRFLELEVDGRFVEEEWDALIINLGAANAALKLRLGDEGDCTEGAKIWAYHRSVPQLPAPLVTSGVYYMLADQGGLVTLLDPETGERTERGRLAGATDAYFAAPVASETHVYMLSESGILSVLEAGAGLEPVHTAHFEEACLATPALARGRIWLRTEGHLYCFAAD